MLKISYKNPMTQLFQYEYALYMAASDLFAGVECRSMIVDRLRLYYMDLVKVRVNKESFKESVSYEKQYDIEAEMQCFLERDVIGKVVFPGMHMCHAELKIRTQKDGSHVFVFGDGIYGFELSLKRNEKGRCIGIAVRNITQIVYKQASVERSGAETAA